MERNPHFAHLKTSYLFQEIRERITHFKQENPSASLITFGIGDTTEPLVSPVIDAFVEKAKALGTREGYAGYGPEQGSEILRKKISEKIYDGVVNPTDIFISDGAKCDIARLQVLFGQKASIAIQDPTYPAYLDSALLVRGGGKITLLPCLPENNFTPDITKAHACDVIFLCSPNNPTGTAFRRSDLVQMVAFAKKHKQIIVYDTAYNFYISEDVPKTIYEIPGAEEVAIELGSFSKIAGFSGIRLGWVVVPHTLHYKNGGSVKNDWIRIITTLFNGASCLSQAGGVAAFSDEGLQEIQKQIAFYRENITILAKAFSGTTCTVYGGKNAPYIWVFFPNKSSWQAFDEILARAHIITTPGSGFGPSGEGFLRISGFGARKTIEEAKARLERIIT